MAEVHTAKRRHLASRLREHIDHLARHSPARLVMLVFAFIILIITSLLLMPFATVEPGTATFIEALFTATSAVCVTGLTVVDTASHWTGFGQVVVVIGVQIGGWGVMTLASILARAVSRHIGLTQRILAASERKSRLGDVGALLQSVVITSLTVEGLLVAVMFPSIMEERGTFLGALGHSIFMAVSTFNNAGFVIIGPDLTPFVGNWAISLPIILGTVAGAIGFPVIHNIAHNLRSPKRWSLHTKITVVTYVALWVAGIVMVAAFEWNGAFSDLTTNEKVLASFFQGTTPRSSGMSTVDIGSLSEATWFVMDALMFIGAGSASTGGGIKVTTFAVLLLAIVAEARGDRDTEAFGKRIPPDVIRLSISAAFLGAFLVGTSTLIILQQSNFPLSRVLFDVISAFATCGLSTGITADLPDSAKLILVLLMYLGRLGTMTFAAALALRTRRRVIRLPEDRPIIG